MIKQLFELFSMNKKPAVIDGVTEGDDSRINPKHHGDFNTSNFSFSELIARLNLKNIWIVPVFTMSITFIIVSLLMVGIIYETKHLSNISSNQITKTEHILNTIQDMSVQLESLSNTPASSKQFTQALGYIQSDLSDMQKSLSTHSDITKVSTQISSFQNDMDSQMSDLKKDIAGSGAKSYLESSVLPFKVISVDVISQQPFVTIDYQHKQTPLAIGDSLAGWKVTSADYQNSVVEFENDKGQFVKVILQEAVS